MSNLAYDVAVIGAGVIGCAIARELSRYRLRIVVLEKELDVGFGTSSRNSGVLHAGFNYTPGSLRARLCVRGNAMMEAVCRDLKVRMNRIGKLTVAMDPEDVPTLYHLLEQGKENGVPDLELVGSDRIKQLQPGLDGILALYTPSSGIISPYGLTIAYAENALDNGVEFRLGTHLDSITRIDGQGWSIGTKEGARLASTFVVNAAGLFSAEIATMAGCTGYAIFPCRGEYHVLDKRLDGILKTLVYPVPKKDDPGLGIHVTPTVDGNILVGPSAEYCSLPEDNACNRDVMDRLRQEASRYLPGIKVSDYIRSFAGVRPKQTPPQVGGNKDFTIAEAEGLPGLVNLVGIESPGLTSSPAIAEMVAVMIGRQLKLKKNHHFNPERRGSAVRFCELPLHVRTGMIAKAPNHGEVVCRCEGVTKHEILEAVDNPLGARTIAGIKYRTRAGMGRCQGGFCLPRIVRILTEERGWQPESFLERSKQSVLFSGRVRETSPQSGLEHNRIRVANGGMPE
jgi:glycerol-3-phosphate dehydrogenase